MTLLPPPADNVILPRPPRLRVWPSYVAVISLIVGILAAQIGIVLLAGIFLAIRGVPAREIQNTLTDLASAPAYLAVVVMVNIGFELCAALLPAMLSPVPLPRRLSLRRPRISFVALSLAALGVTCYAVAYDCFASLLALHSDTLESFSSSLDSGGPISLAVILFAVCLGAPIAEELFFRGYLQTRLAARHGPVLGILITAFFFGLIHMDPVQSPFAFGFGIYLGIIAYRSRSIFPTIFAHAFSNTCAVLLSLFLPLPHNALLLTALMILLASAALLLLLPTLLLTPRD